MSSSSSNCLVSGSSFSSSLITRSSCSLAIRRNEFFPSTQRRSGSDNNSTINTNKTLKTHFGRVLCNSNAQSNQQPKGEENIKEEEEEEYRVVTAVRSMHNDIIIVDTAKARFLLLDSTHNVHSVLNKGQKWTGSYWDEFVTLPPIVPEGPIAIYGLGGGTAAHLMLDVWPHLQLHGWEIDQMLIDKAREYFGLSDLETRTKAGGILNIHIGDALSSTDDNPTRYAVVECLITNDHVGIVIDLFSEGNVLAQLQEVATWLELNKKLMPNGRLMVNCGDIDEKSHLVNGKAHNRSADTWDKHSTIKALSKAFPGQLSWKRMPDTHGANYLALTGPLPDLTSWSAMVPDVLSESVRQWRPCAQFQDEAL
ncbi:hypothetical protein Tsubulata_037861 [Turnera subulata]|uniref:PABS domain-containing protein n=1 Tax=Turnera subulata TaxID=218843 RepID=A0A9Q0G647_9ROSI|nr:hypothetical protein Tsubulata_037861 [Turnera subulata]